MRGCGCDRRFQHFSPKRARRVRNSVAHIALFSDKQSLASLANRSIQCLEIPPATRRCLRLPLLLFQFLAIEAWRCRTVRCNTQARPSEGDVMKRTSTLILAILVLCLGAPATPTVSTALAQSVTIDRDGIRIDRRSRGIDRREAIRIAQRNGIHRVRDASLRGRDWIVRGETRRRRELLRLTINARSGRVVGRRYTNR